MTAFDLALAASLLAGSPDAVEPTPDPADWPGLQEAVQETAVQWEILDHREVRYVMARLEDWDNDLGLLRRRYADLKDAPKLCDAQRFPDRGAVNDLLAFNRGYRRQIDTMLAVNEDRAGPFRSALKETDYLYQVWDSVRDARCEYYYITVRRQALKRLKTMIGTEAFEQGRLPTFVPLWRFRDAG